MSLSEMDPTGSTGLTGKRGPQKQKSGRSLTADVIVSPGNPWPPGLHECCDGINIAVFSRHATHLTLLLYDDNSVGGIPAKKIDLDDQHHRTGDMWHARVSGNVWGRLYALQADGPNTPLEGHRFDKKQALLDPYAAVLVGGQEWVDKSGHPRPHCVMADHSFDWQGDAPPRHPWSHTVIYETHVRGLSIHPSSRSNYPGQYLGVVEKIPYLKDLGITALELMPVQAFNPHGLDRLDPLTGQPLRDYWGYNPAGLFAPMADYADGQSPDAPLITFKTMVSELHKAGIEVILDVVFNHTGEGNETGPTLSFRGLDNAIYYMLGSNKQYYLDYTGCGNTLNCNHPVVRSMIIDRLRHWVMHMHVDGFRFDLASVLGRGEHGQLLPNPPLLEQIAEDPILRPVKLIGEAWDSAGAFQVGSFPGRRWAEWNCHFRDDVRRFWRGDPGMSGRLANRLCGSADLYQHECQSPIKSINFVTCHDGFTLNDLVSYAAKHNEANGEENRDETNENFSDNNGTEGPTDDAVVDSMRRRQIKNMLATLFLSRGVPMLLGGDEFRRTQSGNNNAYCQDNEMSWYNWALAERHADIVRFVRNLVAFRRAHPILTAEHFYMADDIQWFGTNGLPPDWGSDEGLFGCVIPEDNGGALCFLFNATQESRLFTLPPSPTNAWYIAIDTSKETPADVHDIGGESWMDSNSAISIERRTTIVLVVQKSGYGLPPVEKGA